MKISKIIVPLLTVSLLTGCFGEKNENTTDDTLSWSAKELPNKNYALSSEDKFKYIKEYKALASTSTTHQQNISNALAKKVRELLLEEKFDIIQKLIDRKKITIYDAVKDIDFIGGKTKITTFALKNHYDLNKHYGVILTYFFAERLYGIKMFPKSTTTYDNTLNGIMSGLQYLVQNGLSLQLYKLAFMNYKEEKRFILYIEPNTIESYPGTLFLDLLLYAYNQTFEKEKIKKLIEYTANLLGKNRLNTKHYNPNMASHSSYVWDFYKLGFHDLALKYEIANEPIAIFKYKNKISELLYLPQLAAYHCDLDTLKKSKTDKNILQKHDGGSLRDMAYKGKCHKMVNYLKNIGIKHHKKEYLELNDLDDI